MFLLVSFIHIELAYFHNVIASFSLISLLNFYCDHPNWYIELFPHVASLTGLGLIISYSLKILPQDFSSWFMVFSFYFKLMVSPEKITKKGHEVSPWHQFLTITAYNGKACRTAEHFMAPLLLWCCVAGARKKYGMVNYESQTTQNLPFR